MISLAEFLQRACCLIHFLSRLLASRKREREGGDEHMDTNRRVTISTHNTDTMNSGCPRHIVL